MWEAFIVQCSLAFSVLWAPKSQLLFTLTDCSSNCLVHEIMPDISLQTCTHTGITERTSQVLNLNFISLVLRQNEHEQKYEYELGINNRCADRGVGDEWMYEKTEPLCLVQRQFFLWITGNTWEMNHMQRQQLTMSPELRPGQRRRLISQRSSRDMKLWSLWWWCETNSWAEQ